MKNIVLIGFMGTGKTSTGRALSQRLGKAFIDLDQYIEEAAGETIPQMFEQRGEAYFRAREREAVEQVAGRQNAVISTGGGTVKDPINVSLLKRRGVMVCLTARPETILARTAHTGERPVLDGEDTGDRLLAIERLLKERERFYAQADFSVDTSDVSPMQVTERIVRALKARGELRG